MAYSRLLLLMIGVISSLLPEVHTRPIDFWCNSEVRGNFLNLTKLKEDMAGCVGSDTLSSPVQLPCVGFQPQEWANKSLQQKHAEVVGALKMFKDAVRGAKDQSTLECQTLLLGTLAHRMTNVFFIVNKLQIQKDTGTPSHSAVQTCPTHTSLNKVHEVYEKLLNGKLHYLAEDLKDSMCKAEQRTA